ncbi:MAG: LL-diaminopimelate aminotransferase [Vulcanibacillus sp.]
MSESYIQRLFADRIGGSNFGKDTAIYKFEKIKRAKAEAKLKFPDIELIDMGVGEPDQMADDGVINALYEAAKKPENKGYADNGGRGLKVAVSEYLKEVYGVENIDPDKEVIHVIGSKSCLSMLPTAFINSGDIVLMTVPGYPILGTHTEWLDGEVIKLPLVAENNFLPDLDAIDKDTLKKVKLLYLNYPNNPTGASATKEFFEKVIRFAKENNIIVIQDAAYAALTFDGNQPLSFLSIPGAKDVGIEVHSLSKAYNMTGWRIGFIAGNELIVKAFANVKDNNDSGQFLAIQEAAIYALKHPEITKKTAEKYSRRHNLLVATLNELGFNAKKPKGSFYLYVAAPKGLKNGLKFNTAEEFSQYLIKEKLISTVPWDDIDNYVRFSVTFAAENEEDEKRVISEIKRRLSSLEFEF